MTNNNHQSRKYAVLDVEVLNAMEEYAAYRRIDPRAAELRWPFRRVCAVSLMTFSINENDHFQFGTFESFAGPDEHELLKKLFRLLQELPDYKLVTYGGQSFDLCVIRMGACEHQLALPPQLINGARRHGEWLHRDLALEIKGGAGPYIHLTEVAVRLHLPAKFGGSASMVPMLVKNEQWARLAEISDADVIVTSMVLASLLCAHGELTSASAAHYVILDEVWKRREISRYRDYVGRIRKRVGNEMNASAQAFVDAA
jgi:DNA polymerase elongation subunit (family B)